MFLNLSGPEKAPSRPSFLPHIPSSERFARHTTPYCKAFKEPDSWREIPAIPLTAFRHAAIRSFPEEETIRSFRTSGTTGEGYGEHHFRTLELYRAAAIGGWQRIGLPTKNLFCLMPAPAESPNSSLCCMAGWLAPPQRFFLGDWDRIVGELSGEEEGAVLFGTALAFLDFFQWLGNREVRLPPGSVAVETGGYKGTRRSLPKSELYALFQRHLGLGENDVWNEYGMTELSSQFYTHGLGNPHLGAPWVRSLVIDPESGSESADGETGILRIFDLANIGSCCALQTGDLAIAEPKVSSLSAATPLPFPAAARDRPTKFSPNEHRGARSRPGQSGRGLSFAGENYCGRPP